ncbi:MAG TPA: uroporphyrinogen-III synthase [Thermoplasmata archaeon]|nr:uroporphyrinogen-III synthase [Thermoplasmata archaeon]
MSEASRTPQGPVLIVAAAGTLVDLERALRAAGIRTERFDATRFEPCLSPARERRLRSSSWDGVVVSSPRVLDLFLVPVFGRPVPGRPAPVAYVAGEPTAAGAAALGYPVVRPTAAPGLAGIAAAIPSGPRLRILNARSDIAGPGLTRMIRARGHTVLDVVAIRTVVTPNMPASARRAARDARGVVVSSATGLRSLRRHLGREAFRRLALRAPFRVLGETTATAARRLGVGKIDALMAGPSQAFDPATVTSLFDGD